MILNQVRTKIERNAGNELLWFGNNAFVNNRLDTSKNLELMRQKIDKNDNSAELISDPSKHETARNDSFRFKIPALKEAETGNARINEEINVSPKKRQ